MTIKNLGLLRLGDKSTLLYINELKAAYSRVSKCTFPVTIVNTDFTIINDLLPTPSKQLDEILQKHIDELCALNIKAVLIPNITLHETIDRLKIKVPIIHPLHLTISEIKRDNQNEVVLFGSKYTMQSNYIKSIFEANNIKTLLPTSSEMQQIDDIRRQVYLDKTSDDLLDSFHLLIEKYAKTSSIIIACTELSLVLPSKGVNIFDMARIQINEASTIMNNS